MIEKGGVAFSNVVGKFSKEFAKSRKFPLYYKTKDGILPMIGYDGTGQGLLKAYRNTLPAGQLTQFNKAYEKALGITRNQKDSKKGKGASRFNTK